MKTSLIVKLQIKRQILSLLVLCLVPFISLATTYTVTSSADDGSAGTLRAIINQLNTSGTSGSTAANNTINFNAGLTPITLTSNLPVIKNGVNIVAPAAGQTISGNNLYRLLATFQASLGLANLTLSQGLSQGGAGVNGGGGGLGAGGAVYVDLGQTLSVTNTTMQNCFAKGGAGAALGVSGGGGGGAGWSIGSTVGTTTTGGGDYPGNGAAGGAAAYAANLPGYGGGNGGAGGGSTGGTGGGTGSGINGSTSNGGNGGYCGGGGGASDTTNNSAGGGGGNGVSGKGGGSGNTGTYSGGGGGGYGSGGAGAVGAANFGGGGGGGFGGGGGAGSLLSGSGIEAGGGGGFGGGGGSGSAVGFGGSFGGSGVANNLGGGGAGIGGAIFVGDGAILQIGNSVASTSNSTAYGTGGNNGSAYANDVFLFRGAALQFISTSSFTAAFAIQADTSAPIGHLDAGVLVNTTNNAIITFNANGSNYQGGTTVQAGSLVVSAGTLPTTGAVNIGTSGTLALLADSVSTAGAFSNAGALNLSAKFTPTNYSSFANTSTGKVYVIGSGSIASDVTTIGSLSIGQDSLGNTNVNNLSISNNISFNDINVYNTSTLATTGIGAVTGRLYMLGTSTFSGNNISGTILTTGQDSLGNSVSSTAFSASQAISTFPIVNVKAGSFTTNGFAMSNVNTAFTISSGATATFDAIVGGTATLLINGTLNNSILNGLALTNLVTVNGTLNVLQSLTLGNNINCAGNIAVSASKTLTSNSTLYAYSNSNLSGDIAGGGASSVVIGLDSLGTTYPATKATINSNISTMPILNVANGTLTANGTIGGVNTTLNVANGAQAFFNGAVSGSAAASNTGFLQTSAAVSVTSYTSTGTTQFAITDASTTGSITTTGDANFGATPIVVSSKFITPLPGITYPWTLVTAAPLTALSSPPTLPPNTVANIWSYSTTGTQLKVQLEKFQLRATTPILGSVINAMSLNPSNLNQFILINALGNALTQTQLDNDVKQLIPELNSSLVNVMKQDAVFRQIGHRITAIRENLAYNNSTGFAAGDIGNDKAMWIGPFGSIAQQGPTANNFGYKAYSGGVILGFDMQLNDRTLLGIAGARSSTNIQTKLNGGLRTRTIGYHTLVYGNHVLQANDASYIEWMGSLGLNQNYGVRQILISGDDFTTNAKYTNYQTGFLVNYGKNYRFKTWGTFTPLATMQYSLINTPPYSETASSPAALYVKNNRMRNVFTLGLGGKTTIKTVTSKLITRYTLGAIVAYDVISTKQITNANFLSGSSIFTFASSPSRFSVNLDADCALDITAATQLQFGYELQLRQGYISNAVTAKFKYFL